MEQTVIYKDDKYVQLCEFDEAGEIRFTKEFLALTKTFPGTRKLASQLITHWGPEFAGFLDYFGPPDAEEDKYSGIDGEPMDVKEDMCDLWEYKELAFDGLDAEWYRDVLRAKLVTLKLPERLLLEYLKVSNKYYTRGV
jgi:hypothetical protein